MIGNRIPGEQMQCLLLILRKTYGYRKKEDKISLSQFVRETGINKPCVCRALKSLRDRKIIIIEKDNAIIKKDNNQYTTYRFNKNYEEWIPLSKKITLSKKIMIVIEKDNLPLSKKIHTKETITKETITKDTAVKKRRGQIPENFTLTDPLKQFAISKNIDPEKVDDLFQNFREYHESHGTVMLDWNKAWHTFVRNAPKFSQWAVIDESKSKYGF